MQQSYETHSDFIVWNFSQQLTSRRATALRSATVFSPGDRRRRARRLFYFQIALYLPICFTIARLRMFLPCRGNDVYRRYRQPNQHVELTGIRYCGRA